MQANGVKNTIVTNALRFLGKLRKILELLNYQVLVLDDLF